MLYFRRSRFVRTVIVPLTLIAFLPACHKWVGINTTVDSPRVVQDPVRVTLTDGREIDLENVTLTADSLFGRRKGTPGPVLGTEQDVRVSLDDVQRVAHKESDGGATLALVGGIVGAVVILSVAAISSLESKICDALESNGFRC